ncbi:MAG: hypothetical protein KatS3mg034_1174 [Vicingaceae bacterium]|nr:MAG: hypothetical protein KatS3mg034_1174 [Vicingaceae bacterium]
MVSRGRKGDDEVFGKNNLWAYKYRLHDARLGRFFSVDPLADKYPFYSFYQFSGNRLIDKVELEGLEPGEPGTEENQLETAPVEGNEEGPEHVWLWQNNKWVDYGQKMPEVIVEDEEKNSSNEQVINKRVDFLYSNDNEKIEHILNILKNSYELGKDYIDLREIFDNFPTYAGGVDLVGELKIDKNTIYIHMNIAIYNNMKINTYPSIIDQRGPFNNVKIKGLIKNGYWDLLGYNRYNGNIPMLWIQTSGDFNVFFKYLYNE